MNLISTAYCLLWAAQTHIQRMHNDVHMCVQICIIYMCARAEGDGTLRDGRLRVADGLIPHIHLSYQGKEGKPFLADVSGERKTQKSSWCLHSLSGNFGGLSLTSVRVILTSVVPDSPPM